ncbi:hypothetical protein [Maricaulis sp.]|uniref:hypothetical protein n=1 Tax=Maricaulis sp. TaxID=1486257 RepID=UPI00261DDD66|nr:hypothetical protein [Maricaulis sp.]
MSVTAAIIAASLLGAGQPSWPFGSSYQCRRDPDGYECFCDRNRSHEFCRNDYRDLDPRLHSRICAAFPNYYRCDIVPATGRFRAVVDYSASNWELMLYDDGFALPPLLSGGDDDLDDGYPDPLPTMSCTMEVRSQRGAFELRGRFEIGDSGAYSFRRSDFTGRPPTGSPRHVDALFIECFDRFTGERLQDRLVDNDREGDTLRWRELTSDYGYR